MMPVVVIQFFGGSSRLVILLYGKICDGRKRGVQAEIVLHLLEYTLDGGLNKAGCIEYFVFFSLLRIESKGKVSGLVCFLSSHFGLCGGT